MFFGLFSDSVLVNKYADMLFDEFIRVKNAELALAKAAQFANTENISRKEIQKGKEKVAEKLKSYLLGNAAISEKGLEECSILLDSFNLEEEKKKEILKIGLDKYYIQSALSGNLLVLDKNVLPIPIIFNSDEDLYYCASAAYVKKRSRTRTVNYNGFTGSIKIGWGVRYRMGSININRVPEEYYDTSDRGIFFITSQRLGYIGQKQFSINWSQVVSLQSSEMGLLIFKRGRENPFSVFLMEYDVPLTIISTIMNKDNYKPVKKNIPKADKRVIAEQKKPTKPGFIVKGNRAKRNDVDDETGFIDDRPGDNYSTNVFHKVGHKWNKQKKRSRYQKYSYTVCDYTDEGLFYEQCQSIEKHFPSLIKDSLFKDADGSLFQRYHHKKGDIVICNHEAVGALYISSDFDLEENS